MTFGEFIITQFKNKSKMDYKIDIPRLDSVDNSKLEKMIRVERSKPRKNRRNQIFYYDELDFSKPISDTDIISHIKENYQSIFINIFDFPKVIVNPKVYDFYMTYVYYKGEISFARFLEILTDDGEPRNLEYMRLLGEKAGVPTKVVGGGETSSDFYALIDKQLEKGVPVEELDVLSYVKDVGYEGISSMTRICFKLSTRDPYEWAGTEEVEWEDTSWSLHHNSWWFPPNIFVLNVDETKNYPFINWLRTNPLEVKE